MIAFSFDQIDGGRIKVRGLDAMVIHMKQVQENGLNNIQLVN